MVHEWAVTFVEHRIGDKRVIRLIRKWLTAGVLEDGTWTQVEQGSPQGGSASPLLANVYRRLFGYGGTAASLLP
jgi:retron-type reverse transcriptase